MKKSSMTLISIAAGGVALLGAAIGPSVRQACADELQRGHRSHFQGLVRVLP
jgi:hypothetical protein